VLIAAACASFGYLGYVYLTLPDVAPLQTTNPATTAFIELRAREAHAKGRPSRRVQRWVTYGRIAPALKRAVLVAEDAGFWQHEGIDVEEIRKSIERDLERGSFSRGGSTITQQLAKNLYLTPSKNPVRKLKELLIARRLEAQVSKRRILEIYLNVIEWGDGVYGAEAASREHFGKPASALGADEAALLAAAIINPRVHNPSRPTARLLRRQRLIRARMGGVTPPPDSAPAPQAAPGPVLPAGDR
jgi:monofunctional biosynthetic peptidoglycan transglycosylase